MTILKIIRATTRSTVGVALWLFACHQDATSPPRRTAISAPASPTTQEAPEPSAPTKERSSRSLWFADGPGYAAMMARERRDYAAAQQHLDTLLANPSLDANDRAAAQLLRAIEHRRHREFAEAAELWAAARGAPSLALVEPWIRLWEAQARLAAGEPARARELLIEGGGIDQWARSALATQAQLAWADALVRTGDADQAERVYRDYLRQNPRDERRFEVRIKLAQILAARESVDARREALTLFDGLRLAVPLSDYAQEATSAMAELEQAIGPLRQGAEAKVFARELALVEAEAQLERRRYTEAIAAVDALPARSKLSPEQRCRAGYTKGAALFKLRKRADARPSFEQAARDCAQAGEDSTLLLVKSRYQAARGWYASGNYKKAGQAFESLATEFPRHSYADDALVLAGESWESQAEPAKAAEAYRNAIEKHPGDMQGEARRRLLVMHLMAAEDAQVLALVDAALKTNIARPVERAKLHYFRGRALERLGRDDEAVAAWFEVLGHAPLSYPGLVALGRLRERGAETFAAGLARLEGVSAAPTPPAPPALTPELRRAEVFARLGLGEQARQELEHGTVDPWTAIDILTRAGLYPAAQRALANLGSAWRSSPPGADNRAHWWAAYPRPFVEIISPGERAHQVPRWLTYAIMQTESRFEPGATSSVGARGLVQLMPSTAEGVARRAGVRLDDPAALYDPALNLDLGMRHLGRLTERFGGGDGAVALVIPSYNAGEGSVDRWLRERGDKELDLFIESIPYDETRKYTQSVLGRWWAYRWLYGEGTPDKRVPQLPRATPSHH